MYKYKIGDRVKIKDVKCLNKNTVCYGIIRNRQVRMSGRNMYGVERDDRRQGSAPMHNGKLTWYTYEDEDSVPDWGGTCIICKIEDIIILGEEYR